MYLVLIKKKRKERNVNCILKAIKLEMSLSFRILLCVLLLIYSVLKKSQESNDQLSRIYATLNLCWELCLSQWGLYLIKIQ